MSKTIKMPEGINPLKIRINNGPEQVFVAGQNYTVSDDVYNLIVNNLKETPKKTSEVQPVLPGTNPAVDAGKYLKVGEDGQYILADVDAVEVNPGETAQSEEVRGLKVNDDKFKVLSHYEFTNVSVATAAFKPNATYTGYNYRANIALSAPDYGVSSACFPIVCFAPAEATSGNYAPIAEAADGGVYIYAKEVPEAAITIPSIYILK